MPEPDWDELGLDPHPLAEAFEPPGWETPGKCVCGAELPPMREWTGAGRDWASIICGACTRGYVDEEDFTAIYDDSSEMEGTKVTAA